MARPPYTPEEKAATLAALAANAGNFKRTARQCGVSVATLKRWAARPDAPPGPPKKAPRTPGASPAAPPAAPMPVLVAAAKVALADRFELLAGRLLGLVEDASLAVTDVGEAVRALTAAAVAVDKMRLLREQPTVIGDGRLRIIEEIVDARPESRSGDATAPPPG